MQQVPQLRPPIVATQPGGGLKGIDLGYYIRHYWDLCKRWLPYLLVSGPVGALVAGLVGVQFGVHKNPAQEVTALVGIENPARMSGVGDFGEVGDYRAELLRSRNFLRQIVDKLSLQLRVVDLSRKTVFDSVRVDTLTAPGKYELTIDKKHGVTYELRYTNERQGIVNRVLSSGPTASLSTLAVPGAYLRLSREFLSAPHGFAFSVIPRRFAVDNLLHNLSVQGPRRDREYIRVSYRGRDYPLIAETVNAIADHYVTQNLAFRKRRTHEALEILEKQLKKAEEQLAVSEGELRSFLSANPNVALTTSAQQTIAEIMSLEATTHRSSDAITDAENLRDQYTALPPERRESYIGEIAIFLQAHGALSAQALRAELQQLLRERADLEQRFAPNHPAVQENRAKLEALGNRALESLNSFISSSRERIQQRRSGISRLTSRLSSLPTAELRLAELQRKQQIDSEIYSTVLAKYNEVKVANAVEVADVFVMDHAVPPYAPSLRQRVSMLLAICLLTGIGVSVGPPVLADLLDKTARTGKELEKMTDLPLLEVIPVIPAGKRGHA